MHPRQPLSPELLRLAACQAEVVTTEQAAGLGVGRNVRARLVREARWQRVTVGVLLTSGAFGWEQAAWAGVLVGGDHARLGGEAAAFAHRLVDEAPDDLTIWVPAGRDVPRRRAPSPYHWTFRRELPGARVPTSVGQPPRLSVEETVIDLVSVADEAGALHVVSAAVQRRLTTPTRLLRAFARRRQLRHRALLVGVLADIGAGAETPLELRYLRDVERAHGLPTARRQVRRGSTVADAFYEEFRTLVELDGRLGHQGAGRFRDMWRDNTATQEGLATLRYGWSDVAGRPCLVAAQVADTLRLRGWTGRAERCPGCARFRMPTSAA